MLIMRSVQTDHMNSNFLKMVLRNQISDALRDLVPFVQFKKREKHPWKSVNFSKVAGFSLQLY